MNVTVESFLKSHIPPVLLNPKVYEELAQTPASMNHDFPPPTWTYAKKSKDGRTMPQAIAHRGYKAKYPENTMGAFRGAVEAGAHAIETDIHLSKDDEVVISHDATLKRCFGKDDRIIACDWEFLSTARTLRAPHEPMPRLRDILEYLATPGLEDIWLLLDIKLDNDADTVMRRIAETIESIPPNPRRPWNKRVVLGCWAAKYLPLCAHYLPNFSISHIGFSTSYARQFLSAPHVSFNLLQKILFVWPSGPRFIHDAHALNRPVYAWTVNEDEMMKWCISKSIDGVITDDPKRFLEVCDEWESGKREIKISWGTWAQTLWIYLMVCIFGVVFRWKYRARVEGRLGRDREGAVALKA